MFGLYNGCNPNASTGIFACRAFSKGCWYEDPMFNKTFSSRCDKSQCHCDAVDKFSVGKDTCNMCERNASWHPDSAMWRKVEALGQILNGSWFSTQAAGECKQGQRVGKDCWWRLVELRRRVNETCVSKNVINAVLKHGQKSGCLKSCPDPTNRSSTCWVNCLFDSIVGSPAMSKAGIAPMTKAQILAPFVASFGSSDPQQGGCIDVPPCPAPCKPSQHVNQAAPSISGAIPAPTPSSRPSRPPLPPVEKCVHKACTVTCILNASNPRGNCCGNMTSDCRHTLAFDTPRCWPQSPLGC
jgi:hypothetical protein